MTDCKTIWEYKLKLTDRQTIQVPAGSEILTVQFQGNDLCLWALVNPDMNVPKIDFHIEIFGTDCPVSVDHDHLYIGTAQHNQFVWHVFETV